MKNKTKLTFRLNARYVPAVRDGDNACAILSDLEENRHGEVEVSTWRVTPAAIVARLGKVWRAKVGCGYEDGRTT